MIKNQKYFGEVWLADNEQTKSFCVMSMKDNDILLETNLISSKLVYKELQILGLFTGLGHITFIDCKIRQSLPGSTESRVYCPRYSFISAHHPKRAVGLKFDKFQITNIAIVDWVNYALWYDMHEDELIKKDNIKDEYRIDNIGLTITLNHSLNIHAKRRELLISNIGYVTFQLDNSIGVLKAIEIYNYFQKILLFLTSKSIQFENFGFQCLTCREWANIYYNDDKYSKSTNTFINTNYDEVKNDLLLIFKAAYNDEPFMFCLNKLMENIINKYSSHNKRFTNSISTFEAFGKQYSKLPSNNLKKYLKHYSEYFILLGEIEKSEFDTFTNKVIRSRDYHIHSNLDNKGIYSEFELLYISFLIEFVVGYGLLCTLGVSENLKEKVIMKGKSVYISLQRSNEILSSNPLKT